MEDLGKEMSEYDLPWNKYYMAAHPEYEMGFARIYIGHAQRKNMIKKTKLTNGRFIPEAEARKLWRLRKENLALVKTTALAFKFILHAQKQGSEFKTLSGSAILKAATDAIEEMWDIMKELKK